jgi:hypothetical protein
LPPKPPQIAWDGKQLSIKSENSTLADILIAVRSRIKTDIEIPAGATEERVAVELGPGPARDVLTSLLSGSNFDYIIQASDSDENAVQSVLLMARAKSDDDLSGTAVASASGGPMRRRQQAIEAAKEHASTDTQAASETAVAEAGSSGDTSASNEGLPSSHAQPASPAADEVASDTAKAGTDQQIASAAGASTMPAEDAGSPSSSMPQMVQNLQNMYEQRRRLQAQLNQTGAAPSNVENQH